MQKLALLLCSLALVGCATTTPYPLEHMPTIDRELASRSPISNDSSTAIIANQVYEPTEGAIQATIVGRGVTSPQANNLSLAQIANLSYDPTLGAVQVYIDSSSIDELTAQEKSADPSDPDEGYFTLWMSDGTESGDDGDIMVKITAGGSTKTITLIDFSAF